MKKKVLLVTASLALIMTGCAQKKLNTTDDVAVVPATNTTTNIYENVDPMGQGMSQGNGMYGNGMYGNNEGQYGNTGLQNIYFGVDQYNITAEKLGKISHNANILRNSGRVKVEGHCDASGSDEYNYALGLRRAKATKDALIANGISRNNITLVSMGESSPECATSTSPDCYAKNRRVEFKVIQ